MTMMRTASLRWHQAKPVVLALAVGLVLGGQGMDSDVGTCSRKLAA